MSKNKKARAQREQVFRQLVFMRVFVVTGHTCVVVCCFGFYMTAAVWLKSINRMTSSEGFYDFTTEGKKWQEKRNQQNSLLLWIFTLDNAGVISESDDVKGKNCLVF